MNATDQPSGKDATEDNFLRPLPEKGRLTVEPDQNSPPPQSIQSEFIQGAIASSPLWLGIVPFGLAYSLAATTAGLNPFEI